MKSLQELKTSTQNFSKKPYEIWTYLTIIPYGVMLAFFISALLSGHYQLLFILGLIFSSILYIYIIFVYAGRNTACFRCASSRLNHNLISKYRRFF